jgi:hypothetical protein
MYTEVNPYVSVYENTGYDPSKYDIFGSGREMVCDEFGNTEEDYRKSWQWVEKKDPHHVLDDVDQNPIKH